MATGVTKQVAEQVLGELCMRYSAELQGVGDTDQPHLHDHHHEGLSAGAWSINWEAGPFEWALQFCSGGVDPDVYEALRAAGMDREKASAIAEEEPGCRDLPVFIEPVNSHTIGVYPDAG